MPRGCAGGVFEEAIAEAALLLGGGCKIVETVRGSGAAVDAAFWAGQLSREVRTPMTISWVQGHVLYCHVKHASNMFFAGRVQFKTLCSNRPSTHC